MVSRIESETSTLQKTLITKERIEGKMIKKAQEKVNVIPSA